MSLDSTPSSERRSFFTRFHTAAALAALAFGRNAIAQSRSASKFEPAHHDKDDWLDQVPGKHRMLFDSISPDGVQKAILFGSNFVQVNRVDYGMENRDSAVVIVMRYRSVSLGYNDKVWEKYGAAISNQIKLEDPKTHAAPRVNPYWAGADDEAGRASSLEGLARQGVQFAVCNSATQNMSRLLARATSGDAAPIYKELAANLIPNGRLVPAGIVAVGRAQERGYSMVSAG